MSYTISKFQHCLQYNSVYLIEEREPKWNLVNETVLYLLRPN